LGVNALIHNGIGKHGGQVQQSGAVVFAAVKGRFKVPLDLFKVLDGGRGGVGVLLFVHGVFSFSAVGVFGLPVLSRGVVVLVLGCRGGRLDLSGMEYLTTNFSACQHKFFSYVHSRKGCTLSSL
jgi:hypothetical protein